jgi:amylosucrase
VSENKLKDQIAILLKKNNIEALTKDKTFASKIIANIQALETLYKDIYGDHPKSNDAFMQLVDAIIYTQRNREPALIIKDNEKEVHWFLSNDLTGMSLYVDRFCGTLKNLKTKIDYFKSLGVNFLHLMPLFDSPARESDGGYAVSDFRKIDERFGTLEDLKELQIEFSKAGIYLMIDIVLNHTSHMHEWAERAKKGENQYQDFYYFFDDRKIPDEFEKTLPEIFPESSPGNFTYVPECSKWVMTVFHNYQWDLNYSNPFVLVAMLENILFYANLGVDILRIDAPAFIWKQRGTTCQNLPQAHTLLCLLKQCVLIAAPGMAILGEAIVAPMEIMKYFGSGINLGKECDFAYNATQMALQWDALATGDTRIMAAAQQDISHKPFGTSWITYTRSHDDIGLGYDNKYIIQVGFDPYEHRKFLMRYYEGKDGSPSSGALFSINTKTQDARISGSLASLCGLEKATVANDEKAVDVSIKKILLMQAMSFFISGVPMIFYGDELGYTNDYSYQKDPGKSYDNRWMHRPLIDWERNKRIKIEHTTEYRIFSSIQKLIGIRKRLPVVADHNNLSWIPNYNKHVVGFLRSNGKTCLYCIFNFSHEYVPLTWYVFKRHKQTLECLIDHWQNRTLAVGRDDEYLVCEPYSFYLLEETITEI